MHITSPDSRFSRTAMYAAIAGLFLYYLIVAVFFEGNKNSFPLLGMRNEISMYAGAVIGAILLVAHAFEQCGQPFTRRILQRAVVIIVAGCVFVTGAVTMIGNGVTRNQPLVHRHDTYHYLLGPKYFPELRYDLLYKCTVAADSELTKPKYKPTDSIRNLDNYRSLTVGNNVASWKKECLQRFTPARWEAFKQDISLYKTIGRIGSYTNDMGYNGAPFHAFVMGTIANSFTLTPDTLRYATLIDISMICLMLAAISWAAGGMTAGLAGILFFTFVGDRFFIIGNSFGRYVWLALLIIGLCFLIKKRFYMGSLLMGLSAMMTLFPALFFAGIGLVGLRDWIATRQFPLMLRRVILGGITALLVAVTLGSAQGDGIGNFRYHFDKMKAHSEPLTSKRVNLRYFFYNQDAETKIETRILGSNAARYDMVKPFVYATLGLFIALCGLAVWLLVRDAADAAIFMGIALMLTITPIVCYYFTISCMLFVLLRHDMNGLFTKLLVAGAMFGMSYMVWESHALTPRFNTDEVNQIVMNVQLTLYLSVFLLAVSMLWYWLQIKALAQRQAPLPRDLPL